MNHAPHHVIEVRELKKRYRLGVIGGATLGDEIRSWLAKVRGRPNPLVPVGGELDAQRAGEHFWALRGVSFDVQEGEILGIIGKNGAGKSTLLKLLSRITTPTEGTARMKGRVSSLLEVGTGFNPELTGRENIYLNGAILGMSKAEISSKLDEIIAFSGIQHHIDTPTKRYSSGMKVRLGFAVAAHLEPEIMIIDEVLAVGDAEFQRKCLGKMKDVAASGRTVLFVSHNMISVRSLCSRVIWLENGQLRMDGPTEEVVRSYLHTYTASTPRVEWSKDDAPGNDLIRVQGVRVQQAGGNSIIERDEAIQVHITLDNLQIEDDDLNLGINVLTDEEVLVFGSTLRENSETLPTFRRGTLQLACEIPAGLLNSGNYRIHVNVFRSQKILFRVQDAIAFTVHESKRSVSYFGKRPGVVRPALRWWFVP
ncbi:MAG: ABC transporter ATP-binding protein [Flavobacteriales bacterium]|nr:ABC transporter ATP-binding protein [Flavobacteriales bacterium]MCB0783180.1 ABC transporter ATP-binding protein [Flavobacteriales bacterium]MCB0815660.1 ABC transporter ATP-binding protein [Flavobacteriales bacterium]